MPEASAIGPMRETSVSKAVGQSSSVPSSMPIRCVVASISRTVADDGRAVRCQDGQSCGTSWPHRSSSCGIPFSDSRPARRFELSSAPVVSSHMPLPADEQDAEAAAQPLEVVAAHVGDVVERVVEVGGLAALAPRVPGRRVVVARQAEREREQVGALEREVHRVVGAEADADGGDLLRAAAVGVDPRHDLVEDPRLVAGVLVRARLERDRGVRPRAAVEGVDAVELHAPAREQLVERADHAPVSVLPRVAALGREREHRAAVVAVGDDRAVRPDRVRPQLRVAAAHHVRASRLVRCGSNASRQAV